MLGKLEVLVNRLLCRITIKVASYDIDRQSRIGTTNIYYDDQVSRMRLCKEYLEQTAKN